MLNRKKEMTDVVGRSVLRDPKLSCDFPVVAYHSGMYRQGRVRRIALDEGGPHLCPVRHGAAPASPAFALRAWRTIGFRIYRNKLTSFHTGCPRDCAASVIIADRWYRAAKGPGNRSKIVDRECNLRSEALPGPQYRPSMPAESRANGFRVPRCSFLVPTPREISRYGPGGD